MKLFGYVKSKVDNYTFAVPILKDGDNYFLQSSHGEHKYVTGFTKIETNGDIDILPLNENKQKDIKKNDVISHIFVTHNGVPLVVKENEYDGLLDACYRRVVSSTLVLMRFMGKTEEAKIIQTCLFEKKRSKNEFCRPKTRDCARPRKIPIDIEQYERSESV